MGGNGTRGFCSDLNTVYNFNGPDGAYPEALVQSRDGDLFGTTRGGGSSSACGGSCGTAFRITPQGALTSATFDGTDGNQPEAGGVLGTEGLFYATAGFGGQNNWGTVVSVAPLTGAVSVLHSFTFYDGAQPDAPLVLGPNGNYYGTTSDGGAHLGTLFGITPSGTFALLHTFFGPDGNIPKGGLMLGPDGAFYGVTLYGGANNSCTQGCGTIFKIRPSGAFKTIYNFDGTHGAQPLGRLLLAADGNVYGTTSGGGASSSGTVFKLTPAGVVSVLYSFDVIDGYFPTAGLVQATDGKLYGTTDAGGTLGYGTIFSITTGGTFATLYNFDNVHGANPSGGLMQHTNGALYGTAYDGGTSNKCNFAMGCGTVFSFDVGLGPFVTFVVPYGKVGSVVQILGTGLTGTTAVSFNGVPASSFTVFGDTFMSATVPAGATTGPVAVTTPTGTLTSNVNFTVLP